MQSQAVDECGSGKVVDQLATTTSGNHNRWRIRCPESMDCGVLKPIDKFPHGSQLSDEQTGPHRIFGVAPWYVGKFGWLLIDVEQRQPRGVVVHRVC